MGNNQGKPESFNGEVNLNQFRLLRVVGKGAFGKVRIVERKDSGLTFALKYIRKDEVVRSESVRNIIRERRMLEHLNHPFLCNLRYSFQDIEYLYIVVDLMNGGDLRFHISRKAFTEEAIKFWMAELGCALRYIHSQGIVHRDLKPDNVLLDSEGHVHLADFNVASDFQPGKSLRSKSGTLAYLAPEVFEGVGYQSEVDWWSLGVTFYECIYNKRPFEGRNHEQLGENIMKGHARFFVTQPPVSMPCLQAMSSLMEKDRRKRIGATGFETYTNHPFFATIDFYALEHKKIDPIFTPSSDKTNFDATYDLEELLLEEAPLEARARRQKPRPELKEDATDKERRDEELHRMIETLFEPFDYTTVSYDVPAGAIVGGTLPDEYLETTTSTTSANSTHSPPLSPTRSPHPRPDQSPHRSNTSDYFAPLDDSAGGITPTNINDIRGKAHQTAPSSTSYSRPIPPAPRPKANRKMSRGGGMQVTLDEHGSWSDLADHSSTLPAEGLEGVIKKPSKGMLGFLKSKGGRDRSPKPQEPGVLGKEGARHIIN